MSNYAKTEDGIIHMISPLCDTTLCGGALEGDDFGGSHTSAAVDVDHGPVTCPMCSRVILACRGVRVSKEVQS